MQTLILLVTPNNVQYRFVVSTFLLLQNERTVCRTEKTVSAGNCFKTIVCALLPGMVDEQNANVMLVCELSELCYDFIITGVAIFFAADLTHFL